MTLGLPEGKEEPPVSLTKRLMESSLHLRKEPAAAKSLQSCLILCPIDGSPPGSPVPGILQAGTLEWVAISFSTFAYLVRNKNSRSAFIVYRFFDDGHSDQCEVIFHCSFDLHFSNNEQC